jgi:hypothetical protein
MRISKVDSDRVLAHIRAHQPCSFLHLHKGLTGWEPTDRPNKGLLIALSALERAGRIKVTSFKHGQYTRRLYEVRV